MFLFLFYLFIEFVIGKILTFIFRNDYMFRYEILKKDLIEYFFEER